MAQEEQTRTNLEDAAIIAARAALDTEGVYELFEGITDTISENLLGRSSQLRGVHVSEKDGGCVFDISVVVLHGVRIPSAAWKIQENVKHKVENDTGVIVNQVNVHIQGIHYDEGK